MRVCDALPGEPCDEGCQAWAAEWTAHMDNSSGRMDNSDDR